MQPEQDGWFDRRLKPSDQNIWLNQYSWLDNGFTQPDKFTQAVVFIHGIGEQRPMDTLRKFADAVLPTAKSVGKKYVSKPDSLSESFELRILETTSGVQTHFYEYYWADKVEGTKLRHIWTWLSSLLLRRPNCVPRHLRPLWWLSWILIGTTLVAAVVASIEISKGSSWHLPAIISTISGLIVTLLQGFILNALGDAARYLSPHPQNIKLRQTIRAEGIKLLKKIHESGEYDRVVVVGHSLGSVIAYDILKHVWQTYHTIYERPNESDQTTLNELEAAGEQLKTSTMENFTCYFAHYREMQIKLWREIRTLGNPWLVTDLVTLGSPLAHAALLLAHDTTDLTMRQEQRELPTNPPARKNQAQKRDSSSAASTQAKRQLESLIIHHAGLFACTRWTNLYFSAKWGLFGDIVGGPLASCFGWGIRDSAVKVRNPLRRYTLWAHTSYWHRKPDDEMALKELIKTLELADPPTSGAPRWGQPVR